MQSCGGGGGVIQKFPLAADQWRVWGHCLSAAAGINSKQKTSTAAGSPLDKFPCKLRELEVKTASKNKPGFLSQDGEWN